MRSRLPVAGLGVLLALLAGLLAWALGASALALVIAAVLGLVLGVVLGQALMWLRSSAGRVARIEHSTSKRLDEMRGTAERRHEILFKATREARERGAAAEREAKSAASALPSVQKALEQQRGDLRDMRLTLIDKVDDQVVLLEDYIQLMRLVPMSLPMPRPGTWAASEDLLLWLAGYVLEHRPRTVVDLGSGQSSVWMAAAMRTAGYDGQVIGVDHDEAYAQATRELARRQGVEDWLTVVHAPLREQVIEGRSVRWYDLDALAGIEGIDLLCIDGPPGQGTSHARWPALPALHARLSAEATVVLDDMIRRDEQEILEEWTGLYPGFEVERLDFEKGAAIMRRRPAEPPVSG
jgi:predicted O-methyltransferase YrrM